MNLFEIFYRKMKSSRRFYLHPISDYNVNAIDRFRKYVVGNIYVSTAGNTAILQNFSVEKKQQHIGRNMLQYVVTNLKKAGFSELVVYPTPKGNWGALSPEDRCRTLYSIYEKLGFKLEDSKADKSIAGHKMILVI